MREMIRLFVAVLVFSMFSGGLLAAVRNGVQERIEYQQLKFVKGPTLQEILKGCSNDPLVDRFKIGEGKETTGFFVGVFDGKASTVAFEVFGKGYGGDMGVLVAVNLENDADRGRGRDHPQRNPRRGFAGQDRGGLFSPVQGPAAQGPDPASRPTAADRCRERGDGLLPRASAARYRVRRRSTSG